MYGPECATCDATQCLTCNDGAAKTTVNKCYSCEELYGTACAQCSWTANMCTACDIGYVPLGSLGSCQDCEVVYGKGCSSCNGNGCRTCDRPYIKASGRVSEETPAPTRASAALSRTPMLSTAHMFSPPPPPPSQCAPCPKGKRYVVTKGKASCKTCQQLDSKCIKCTAKGYCSKCATGYVVSGSGKCVRKTMRPGI